MTNCSFIEKADKIYINGNIYTGQENDNRYNYIAIKKNIIISVGTGEYSHLVDHSTKIIDLKNNIYYLKESVAAENLKKEYMSKIDQSDKEIESLKLQLNLINKV